MERNNVRTLVSFSLSLAVIFAATAVFYASRAEKYEQSILHAGESALSSLISSAEAMQSGITTISHSDGGQALASAAAEVWSSSQSAKAALSMLQLGEGGMPQYERLLNQAGEYSMSLMLNVANRGTVSKNEIQNLNAISADLSHLCENLSLAKESLDIGELAIGGVIPSGKTAILAHRLEKLEKAYTPTYSLTYDGAYSDHISGITPLHTQNTQEIDSIKALETAKRVSGSHSGSLKLLYQTGGVIPVYGFGDDNTVIEITKNGGMLLTLASSRIVSNSSISQEEARNIALQFSEEFGYQNMKCRYTSVNANILTAELVSSSGNVTVYPDRITIRVALDNGGIVGFDGRRYLMSHTERTLTLPQDVPEGASLALIPTDGQNERLCYEYVQDGHLRYVCCESGLCYAVHTFKDGQQDGFLSE